MQGKEELQQARDILRNASKKLSGTRSGHGKAVASQFEASATAIETTLERWQQEPGVEEISELFSE